MEGARGREKRKQNKGCHCLVWRYLAALWATGPDCSLPVFYSSAAGETRHKQSLSGRTKILSFSNITYLLWHGLVGVSYLMCEGGADATAAAAWSLHLKCPRPLLWHFGAGPTGEPTLTQLGRDGRALVCLRRLGEVFITEVGKTALVL